MKKGFRQSMSWLHTWSGLVLGWFLFLIFLAGTASYFRNEISVYMRPEIAPTVLDVPRAADAAQRYLERNAAAADTWFITPPDRRNPGELSVFWRDPDGNRHFDQVDVRSGERLPARETHGGEFFYRLHFDLHYISAIKARWIVGFCAMMMFVAIVSGVITHKKIFREFFTFRPNKRKRSWLDAHNALAVLSLPYHALITYTGLITLMFLYMPWGITAGYGEEEDRFFDEIFAEVAVPEASGYAAELASLGGIVTKAQETWGHDSIGFVTVHNPGDQAASVVVRDAGDRSVAYTWTRLLFDREGTLLEDRSGGSGAKLMRDVLYGLHIARFADPGLRWLFFLVGLAGTAMVATGLILWSIKHQPAPGRSWRTSFGTHLVASLNVAVVCGLPLAMAGFFWANRLLPLELANRAEWEVHCFFIVWGAALLHAVAVHDRRGWHQQLRACAVAFGALPVVNAVTTGRGLPASLAGGDTVFALFDAAMLVFAVLFALTAVLLQRTTGPGRAAVARHTRTGEA